MADANAIVVSVAIPDGATNAQRIRALDHARDFALQLKRRELRRGVGVGGRPLKPVKPESRPDGAKGPPLSPHQAESRSQKWLRASISHRNATVTLWWSHGWGRILGYHREGNAHLPVRDVIGLTPADRKAHEAEMRRWWGLQKRPSALPAPTFAPSDRSVREGHATIHADVHRLDEAFAKDRGYYVGPKGTGAARPGAYAEAVRFVARARRAGTPITQPVVTVDADGTASFSDGRHRFAALRDAGVKRVAVSVPREHAARAHAAFGAGPAPLLPRVPRAVVPRPRAPKLAVPGLTPEQAAKIAALPRNARPKPYRNIGGP